MQGISPGPDIAYLPPIFGIYTACLRYGEQPDGSVNYVNGANIAGFVKVVDAMLAQCD